MTVKRYGKRDIESLGSFYVANVEAMTAEKLHDKGDIAAELAVRDEMVARLSADFAALQAERDRYRAAVDRDKTGLAATLNRIISIVSGFGWLGEDGAWGSYDYEQRTIETMRENMRQCLDGIEREAKEGLAESGRRATEAMFPERTRPQETGRRQGRTAGDRSRSLRSCGGDGGVGKDGIFCRLWKRSLS